MSKTKVDVANRVVAAILFALFVLPLCHTQSVRPVISEYTTKVAKGSFELVNPGLVPLSVILDPKSFSVSETGIVTYRPLDKSIQLKLSAMSFQIPPEQSYVVFYEAHADVLPAWFVIYSSLGALRKTSAGMNIRIDLPHTVYILPKQSLEKSDLLVTSLGPTADKAHLAFLVTNNGPRFGRILSADLIGKGSSSQGGGFPLFPHGTRIVDVPCKGNQGATKLRLRLRNSKMEQQLSEADGNQACSP